MLLEEGFDGLGRGRWCCGGDSGVEVGVEGCCVNGWLWWRLPWVQGLWCRCRWRWGGCCCVVVGIKVVNVVKYVKDVVELLCVEAILRGGISRVGAVGGRASECNAVDN